MDEGSQRWGPSTKRTVAVILLVLLALVLYRFRAVISPLLIAFLLALILNPVVSFLVTRLHISRGLATGVVFFVLIVAGLGLVAAAPVTAVSSVQRAIRSVEFDLTSTIAEVGAFLSKPIEVGEYSLDLGPIYQELSAMVTSFVGSVAEGTLSVVVGVASGAVWLIFVLIAAFYMVKDAERVVERLDELAPPGYREDLVLLRKQIADVWNAFLRGQLLLALAMAVLTTVVCAAVGMPLALVMGLIAGVMEFIPRLGPVLALIPAVLVALIQGSTFLPLSNFWFAVLVFVLYLLIQQIEGTLLLPRILGHSVNLHPLIVLIGVIVGGSLAGILGMLLSVPVVATLRVIARYVFCRLYDRDPFAEPEEEAEPSQPGLIQRAGKVALSELKDRLGQEVEDADGEQEHSEDERGSVEHVGSERT